MKTGAPAKKKMIKRYKNQNKKSNSKPYIKFPDETVKKERLRFRDGIILVQAKPVISLRP